MPNVADQPPRHGNDRTQRRRMISEKRVRSGLPRLKAHDVGPRGGEREPADHSSGPRGPVHSGGTGAGPPGRTARGRSTRSEMV